MKIDETKSRVMLQNVAVPNIIETRYGDGGEALLFDDGISIERSSYNGRLAITLDTSKAKAEDTNGKVNARWRLFKNPSPVY